MNRSPESLNNLLTDYINRYGVNVNEAPAWVIDKSNLDGVGVFARRDIQPGEIIFKDHPVILGPRATLKQSLCSICYADGNLSKCKSNCGLIVCPQCENSVQHQRECKFVKECIKNEIVSDDDSLELLHSLIAIRGALLRPEDKEVVNVLKAHRGAQHEIAVDVLKDRLQFRLGAENERFMRTVCGAFDANAFETPNKEERIQASLRGLYPLAGLANHNCTPNTFHIFDENYCMIVRASVFIKARTELCHSYTRLTWGTLMRRYHLLHTKRFLCKCDRCLDAAERATYIGSIRCELCKGHMLQIDRNTLNGLWKCERCDNQVKADQVRQLLMVLDAAVASFCEEDDIDLFLKFVENKLKPLVSEFNEIVFEAKYKFIWIVGYSRGLAWHEAKVELLRTKCQFCRDILGLLSHLGLGLCKMRGLLLYEVYRTGKELRNRGENDVEEQCGGEKCLEEAAFILQNDVNAPPEIQEMFKRNNYPEGSN